jgi:hypothetical protein
MLEQVVQMGGASFLKNDPRFDPIRARPDFQKLVNQEPAKP